MGGFGADIYIFVDIFVEPVVKAKVLAAQLGLFHDGLHRILVAHPRYHLNQPVDLRDGA